MALRRLIAGAWLGALLILPLGLPPLGPGPWSGAALAQRAQPEGPTAPDRTTADRQPAIALRFMAAAANPLAAEAGRAILRQGGSALDAAIAIQMVLNLVEPQSSGIGGGGFLVHYDASTKQIVTYDGRETAPAAAAPDQFLDAQGQPLPFAQAALGGHAVGVPGVVRMLEMAHRVHGRLPWARLFEPAMQLAEDGFPISERLYRLIVEDKQLKEFKETAAYFFDAEGNPRPVGYRLSNRPLFETLRAIAGGGADAFYTGAIARDIAAAVASSGVNPGKMTKEDLAGYRAVRRDPVCGLYRAYRICGMGPPSSGGIAIAQTLGILERFSLKSFAPGTVEAVHLVSEASRLAFADRARYVADADFVSVPIRGLIEPRYLQRRSTMISMDRTMGRAEPGKPNGLSLDWRPPARDETYEVPATSHISVVDEAGNAVAFTTSIEQAFGSRVFVRGFLLNNQMTDFAFRPMVNGEPALNRIEPGKRPRSSMSPTVVVDRQGRLVMSVGSPGGARIIPFVVLTLVAALDWNLDMQQAISLPHHVNMNGAIELERGTPITSLAPSLKALGYEVAIEPLTSGLQGVMVQRRGKLTQLVGGADPRREGVAVGD